MADNLGLVYRVVGRLVETGRCPERERDEAIGLGQIGLCRAAKAYAPARGVAFSSWAWPCIRNQVLKGLAEARRESTGFELDLRSADGNGEAREAPGTADRMLMAVTPETRRMLRMHYAEGLTLSEVGRKLGYNAGWVGERCQQGLACVRRCFDLWGEGREEHPASRACARADRRRRRRHPMRG